MKTNCQRTSRRHWLLTIPALGVAVLLPLALMLIFVPLRQVFWGFDDQPLLDVLFWLAAGGVLGAAFFASVCALLADGKCVTARRLLLALAVVELISWPAGILMTHYVERVNTQGTLAVHKKGSLSSLFSTGTGAVVAA